MHYLITGGSGFIGQHWIASLQPDDHITVLTRQNIRLARNGKIIHSLDEITNDTLIDVIINLAGGPIDRRWTASVKEELINSRVQTTRALIKLMNRLVSKPNVFISASAVGYYGASHNQTLDEDATPQASFTHFLCSLWEKEAEKALAFGVRVCITRFGVVLGKNGGFMKKITLPFQLGLGGKLGQGTQFFSWIHIQDVVNGIKYLIHHPDCSGKYNFVAPNVVTNQQLTKILGNMLKRPTFLTLPAWLIKLLFGEMGEALLLKGNKITPKKLLTEGYQFAYSDIHSALNHILKT